MNNNFDFEELSPLQRLKWLKRQDPNDEKTQNIIKIIEGILHKELELMLYDIRNNIKAGIFISERPCEFIYKAEDVEKVFEHKLIEVDGHEN
jgi:hypothetical protein